MDCKVMDETKESIMEERENTIELNGKLYIDYEQYESAKAYGYKSSEHVCIIADRGWIFKGHKVEGNDFKLVDASVVRRWDNGLGIGGLADPEHKDDYTLDYIGDIEISQRAVIAEIPLRW